MGKVHFVLDRKGVRELLQSDEIMQACAESAQQVKALAGTGYDVHVGKTRVNVSVETTEAEARNYSDNTLLKALYGSKNR